MHSFFYEVTNHWMLSLYSIRIVVWILLLGLLSKTKRAPQGAFFVFLPDFDSIPALIHQFFGVDLHPFSENPIGPDLVSQHDGKKDCRNNGNYFQRIW